LHADLVTGLDASLELALADILALSESDVERLAVDHLLVELGNSLGSLIRVAEADETEALALTKNADLTSDLDLVQVLGQILDVIGRLLLGLGVLALTISLFLVLLLELLDLLVDGDGIAHNLGRGNGTVGLEDLAKLLVVNVVGKVFDVEVDTGVLGDLLLTSSLVLSAQLLLTFVLLLSATDVELLTLEVRVVELVDSLGSVLVVGVVDKPETAALASLVVHGKGSRGDISILLEQNTELVLGSLDVDVLDVDVGEVGLHLLELVDAVLLGNVVADVNLLLVQQHAVDALDGVAGGLSSLVVNESIASGGAMFVLSNLTAEDVAESGESVVKSLVVNGGIEVLDEDIALTSLAEKWVALRPHDAARPALDDGVVELLKSALAIVGAVVVDVGVAKRATSDCVTADTDGSDLPDGGEELEKHSLGDRGVELTNVKRSRVGVLRGRSGRGWGLRVVGVWDTSGTILTINWGRAGLRSSAGWGGSGLNVGHCGFYFLILKVSANVKHARQ